MSSNTSVQATYNYLVPADGTTHAVFQQCVFATAGTAFEDWRAFSTNNFRFRPQGAYIDNTGGTATASLSIQGVPFVASMAAGYAGWVSFPSTANLVTIISGTGTVNVTYVDYPVLNSPPVDINGNTQGGLVTVENPVTNPVNGQIIIAGAPISPANAVPVTGGTGTLTDGSGAITTASTNQQIFAANSARKYLLIQNSSLYDMWINFTSAATLSQPSLLVTPGSAFTMENNFISIEAINIICATPTAAYTAKEG